MLRTVGDQHGFFSETVDNHINEIPVKPHFNICGISCIHLKQLACMVIECFPGKLRARKSGIRCELNVRHTVHPVCGHTVPSGQGKQIAVFMILAKSVGACQVFFFTVATFPAEIPVEIAEPDLPVLVDPLLYCVHVIVNRFVHTFHTSGNKYRAPHQFGIMLIALRTELLDQLL